MGSVVSSRRKIKRPVQHAPLLALSDALMFYLLRYFRIADLACMSAVCNRIKEMRPKDHCVSWIDQDVQQFVLGMLFCNMLPTRLKHLDISLIDTGLNHLKREYLKWKCELVIPYQPVVERLSAMPSKWLLRMADSKGMRATHLVLKTSFYKSRDPPFIGGVQTLQYHLSDGNIAWARNAVLAALNTYEWVHEMLVCWNPTSMTWQPSEFGRAIRHDLDLSRLDRFEVVVDGTNMGPRDTSWAEFGLDWLPRARNLSRLTVLGLRISPDDAALVAQLQSVRTFRATCTTSVLSFLLSALAQIPSLECLHLSIMTNNLGRMHNDSKTPLWSGFKSLTHVSLALHDDILATGVAIYKRLLKDLPNTVSHATIWCAEKTTAQALADFSTRDGLVLYPRGPKIECLTNGQVGLV